MRTSILAMSLVATGLLIHPATAQEKAKPAAKKQQSAQKPDQSKGNADTEKLKGRRVMVTEHGAEIRTREGGVVWRAYLGELLTVSLANGEWLWIFERQGWMHSKNIVPHETSIFEMNKRIKKSGRIQNYSLRGIARLNHKQYKEALRDFNEVIRRDPNDPHIYVNRGNAYRFLGKPNDAVNDYTKAITLDNEHTLAMNNRAEVQTELKNFDLAMKDLRAAVLLNQEYPEAHNNIGVVYREMRDYKKAETEFSQAIKLYPRFVEAYANRAVTYNRLAEYEKARQDFSQAIILSPNDVDVLNDFAWFLSTCKDKDYRNAEKALPMVKVAEELTLSKDWNVLDTYSAVYAESGNFPQAERYAEKALTAAPISEQARIRRHLLAYKQRRPIRE